MKITDGAKQTLEKVLSENDAEGILLYTVPGCCGSQFAISLDPAQESDKVEFINGIKVAIDSQVASTEELTLDKEENQEEGLVLIGASSCC